MTPMPRWFLDLLRCPTCPLQATQGSSSGPPDERESQLHFRCGHDYPIIRGIPRFAASDGYAKNFSFEWDIHRRTQLDASTEGASTRRFEEVTGLRAAELRDKVVLDVGVGAGRFADVLGRAGARVVGLDLSNAIEVAHENLAHMDNIALLQADLCSAPLRLESFDFIYSIGVLHHTPDAERSFRALVPHLKRGGSIAIYVYPRYGASWRISDFYRRLTTRLPHRFLYVLSHAAVPLYYLNHLPLIGSLLRLLLPVSHHPNWRWRVLDTFDWYSPRHQSKHTYPEVFRWFRSAGLDDIDLMSPPICVRGRRPRQEPASPPVASAVAGNSRRPVDVG